MAEDIYTICTRFGASSHFSSLFNNLQRSLAAHLLMDRLCNVEVVVGKGWQSEQGQGMPGKCM